MKKPSKIMFFAVLVVWILLGCAHLHAGELLISGADKPIPKNSFAELSVAAEPGDSIFWTVIPSPVKKVESGGKVYFSGPPGATYHVEVIVVSYEQKKTTRGNAAVTMEGGDNPPPPVPPVPPVPPTPPVPPDNDIVSQLAKDLSVAYRVETDEEKQLLPGLRTVYQKAVSTFVDSASTYGELFKMMADEAEKQKVTGKLQFTQRLIQFRLVAVLPSKMAADLPVDKKKVKEEFTKIFQALEKVK